MLSEYNMETPASLNQKLRWDQAFSLNPGVNIPTKKKYAKADNETDSDVEDKYIDENPLYVPQEIESWFYDEDKCEPYICLDKIRYHE